MKYEHIPTDEQLGRIYRVICDLNDKRNGTLLAKMELRDRINEIGLGGGYADWFVSHHYGTMDICFNPYMRLWKDIAAMAKKSEKANKSKRKDVSDDKH